MNKAWSESDIERLKSLAASGASALRASVALRRSLAMTRRKANELGFPFRTNAELRMERRHIFNQADGPRLKLGYLRRRGSSRFVADVELTSPRREFGGKRWLSRLRISVSHCLIGFVGDDGYSAKDRLIRVTIASHCRSSAAG
jgi:hypothetical protein